MHQKRNHIPAKNLINGFVVGAIPILLIYVETTISKGFPLEFLQNRLRYVFVYGVMGALISLVYNYYSKFYPRTARYVVLGIIISYYTYSVFIIIVGAYLQRVGGLIG